MESNNPEKLTSRNIPLPIQREVRQRCGFGCVICGLPLYEYEHMEGWANVQRHVANEITLLCDKHHKERTNGLVPIQAVIEANTTPHNLKEGVSKPYDLHFSAQQAEIVLGSNSFFAQYQGYGTILAPLVIDTVPIIGFILGDEHLLLNLVINDEFNQRVLHIKNNQIFYSVGVWDIQLVGRKLIIREQARKILIEINFQPPDKITIERGRFLFNGIEVLIRPTNLLITNNSFLLQKCSSRNVNFGIVIGESISQGGIIHVQNVSRYLGDRKEALAFEKENLVKNNGQK